LLDNLGNTYRRRTVRQSAGGKAIDMTDLDDLLTEWEDPNVKGGPGGGFNEEATPAPIPPPQPKVESTNDFTFKEPGDSTAAVLEAELNAALDFIPELNTTKTTHTTTTTVEPTFEGLNLDENDENHPRRRTLILESHGQTKNPRLDNLLKDLTASAKAFETPAEPIPINPNIGDNPKATISQPLKPKVQRNEPPPPPSTNVPKFVPLRVKAEVQVEQISSISRPKRQGYCPTCGGEVAGGGVTAMGSEWHKDCFVCSYCKQVLKDGKHMVFKDEPYHHQCVVNLAKQKKQGIKSNSPGGGGSAPAKVFNCKICRKIIAAGERILFGDGSQIHKSCFQCNSCRISLAVSDTFTDHLGNFICGNCARR